MNIVRSLSQVPETIYTLKELTCLEQLVSKRLCIETSGNHVARIQFKPRPNNRMLGTGSSVMTMGLSIQFEDRKQSQS